MEAPFILVNTSETNTYNHLVQEYLDDQYQGPHQQVELRVNESLGQSVILFTKPIDNLEFIRLFRYLSSDKDLKNTGYHGWITVSDEYHSKTSEGDAAQSYARKGFVNTVTDEDTVIVYSDRGERIEFDTNASYQVSEQAEGYRHPEVFPESFTLVETFNTPVNNPFIDKRKGCLGFIGILIAGILLFLI